MEQVESLEVQRTEEFLKKISKNLNERMRKKTVIFGFIATFNEDPTSSGSEKTEKIFLKWK